MPIGGSDRCVEIPIEWQVGLDTHTKISSPRPVCFCYTCLDHKDTGMNLSFCSKLLYSVSFCSCLFYFRFYYIITFFVLQIDCSSDQMNIKIKFPLDDNSYT